MLDSMLSAAQFVETAPIRMVFEFGRFVVLCDYNDRHIPKAAHFWFDRKRGAWVSESYRWASALLMYADADAKKRILDRVVGPTRDDTMFKPATVGRYGSRS